MTGSADLPTLVTDFLDYLVVTKNRSMLTIADYRHYLTRFLEWLNKVHPQAEASDIDMETVRRYRLYLASFRNQNGVLLKRITQTYHIIALRVERQYHVRLEVELRIEFCVDRGMDIVVFPYRPVDLQVLAELRVNKPPRRNVLHGLIIFGVTPAIAYPIRREWREHKRLWVEAFHARPAHYDCVPFLCMF